jgi:hypothetical protein
MDIKSGQKWQLNDPDNRDYGIILTVSHIENGWCVRFSDASHKYIRNDGKNYYGSGINYFKEHWVLVQDVD